ncbi:MAG: hypothetical protein ABJA78_10300 [Ferruginibacter sp.]
MKQILGLALIAFTIVACSNNDNKPITVSNSDSTGKTVTDTNVNSSSGTMNTDTAGMSRRSSDSGMHPRGTRSVSDTNGKNRLSPMKKLDMRKDSIH